MEYYKAYDKRYKQVHSKNQLWASTKFTEEILEVMDKYEIKKNHSILEIGCGEGRDAIKLLKEGYNVLAIDYSKEAIKKCNELTNNEYIESFKQFDVMIDSIDEKFEFIYSIAVLHMFVTDEHRSAFLRFIKSHLTEKGIAFVVVMGDGNKEYISDISNAFDDVKRTNINSSEEMLIASTSCRIDNFETIEKEIKFNNLSIIEKWISERVPDFDKCMCFIVSK